MANVNLIDSNTIEIEQTNNDIKMNIVDGVIPEVKTTTTTSSTNTYSCNFINSLILSANNYIKFDNGIMIQWKKITFTPNMEQWGGLYIYDKDLGNWDIPFVNLLSVFGNTSSHQYWCSGICLSSNTAIGRIRLYRQINIANFQVDTYVLGIGTWK